MQLAQQVLLLRSLQTVRQEARSVAATDDITVLIVSIAETESCRQKLIEMCRLKFADFWRITDRKRHIFEGHLQTCLLLVLAGVCWCVLGCDAVCWCVLVLLLRAGVCLCLLLCTGVCCCVLVCVGFCCVVYGVMERYVLLY